MAVTWQDATPSWDPRAAPPDGAPNIVVVVLDDTGFAHLGCYGSDIETPNIDRLAAEGLRYTNFHTTALCSPTRACLLTGRNHHSVGMRFVSNVDTGFSNCRGVISPAAATMAEILQSRGYNTFALGKWHLANMEDCSPAGPLDHWPLQRGFDRYHGFLGGATDQFSPELVIDNQQVDPPSDPEYHVSEDMVTQAIAMIASQQSAAPGRRFLAYLAFGATHSPHQAPRAYLEKYRGRYDEGWDEVRARWFARQLELRIVPPGTELAPRNPGVDAWDDLDDDRRFVYARMQEAFSAFLDHTDDQIGRFVEFLDRIGQLDDTMFIVLSDNGASQEGGNHGTLNELGYFNRLDNTVAEMVDRVDEIGGPNVYNNYPKGWAQVGNTPLRFYKQTTYEGGIRDPLIIRWPAGIAAKDRGAVRDQYHHAIDLLPTVLDCVGVDAPQEYRGVPQQPIEGTSLRYTFEEPNAPTTRTTQYYEMLGHRAIWSDGWKAVTLHRKDMSFDEDRWALFDTTRDFSECHDLAEEHPERLRQLIDRWWAEAGRYNVLPLDDRTMELFALRRPDDTVDNNHSRILAGTGHIDRFKLPDIRNRSYRIRASIDRRDRNEAGALVAIGARTGGQVLWIADNRLHYAFNRLGVVTRLRMPEELALGELAVGVRVAKTAEHVATVELVIDDTVVDSGEIETMPWRLTMYGLDVGADRGSSVVDEYESPFTYTGMLHHVDFDMDDDRDDLRAAAVMEFENVLADQ